MKNWLWTGLFIIVAGCATTYENTTLPLVSDSEYYNAVQNYTESKQIYDGFVNVLDFRATLLNTKVSRYQVDHYARIYQWDETNYQNEKSKTETKLSKQTDLFLSFFVPERKHDDLAKYNTKWRIFLDVGGKRFEGKAQKLKTIMAEVKSLYPDHTRWSTPYVVTFPVPTSQIEGSEAKLVLTGPIGSATVDFPALK